MKIAKKHHATVKQPTESCTVVEYPLNHSAFNIAIADVTRRYPEVGHVINHGCAELAYVQSGTGKLVVNDEEHPLTAGDTVLIEPGEKYYWEGQLLLTLFCSPAWHPEQHQHVVA